MKRKKSQKNKEIFFLAGLPRSGNTILSSILNQNPDICCTPNSITLEIIKYLFLLKKTDVFINYPDHKSLDNVLSSVYDNYYKNWNYKYIIDRGPAGTEGNLKLIKKHLNTNIKIIFLVRPILEVLASWIDWANKTPNSFLKKMGTPTEICHELMNNNGQIVKELLCMKNLLKPENKHHVQFVNYDEIVTRPKKTIDTIYRFLNIPKFKHNFKTFNQIKVNGLGYNDSIFGEGMHTIKTRGLTKTKRNIKKILPKEIIDTYGKIQFV
jgi:sulfotransferase|tara:strand:+ start:69 stop:869 length:801 start_codon:yes stop_codon:yes gene_type:complete